MNQNFLRNIFGRINFLWMENILGRHVFNESRVASHPKGGKVTSRVSKHVFGIQSNKNLVKINK